MLDTEEKVLNNGKISKNQIWKITSVLLFCCLTISNFHFYRKAENQSESIGSSEESIVEASAIEIANDNNTPVDDFSKEETADWESVLSEDYAELSDYKNFIETAVQEQIITIYGLRDEKFDPQLMASDILEMPDGSTQELYLFWHEKKDDPRSMTYSGILMDYTSGKSTLLFQTDKLYDDSSFDSFYEFYDMQVGDIDGNGEEDIVLLLGTHVSTGVEHYLPSLYCMIGLQSNGEFWFVTDRNEEWLEDILNGLYQEDNTNWKISNIIENIKEHYGNKSAVEKLPIHQSTATYIDAKDKIILAKIDNRSLYFDRELLWEKVIESSENTIQKIKVYKESGEQGCSAKVRISVYLFDYASEEAELQTVPCLYEEISEQYSNADSGYLTDLELDQIIYEDVNGDGLEDLQMTVKCVIKESVDEEVTKDYEITYYQGRNSKGLKIFDEAAGEEAG